MLSGYLVGEQVIQNLLVSGTGLQQRAVAEQLRGSIVTLCQHKYHSKQVVFIDWEPHVP